MHSIASYIDPGTGSMLFTLLIGAATTGYFFARKLVIKARFALSGGRAKALDAARHPYVIFSDDKRYWNVFKPICDEFERRGIELCYWTASPDDPALAESYEHVSCEFIGEENKAFARLNMMEADIVLATTPGLDVYQWKRSKGVRAYVHTFHTVGTALGYRMFGMDYFDAVLLAGSYQIDEIRTVERAREIPEKELVTVGSTYLDAMAERVRREAPMKTVVPGTDLSDPGRRLTVLLAPSWGPNAILSAYGERIIEALLDTGFELVIRPHPQSRTSDAAVLDALMRKYPDGERVEWNFDVDNFDCLARADIMVTDFSGVIFDYVLVFDRPVIYTPANYDDGLYDAAWYDKPQWRFETYPSFGIPLDEADFPRLKEVIESTVADESLAAGRAKARRQAWAHPGEAATRTVDYLVELRERLLEEELGAEELAEGELEEEPLGAEELGGESLGAEELAAEELGGESPAADGSPHGDGDASDDAATIAEPEVEVGDDEAASDEDQKAAEVAALAEALLSVPTTEIEPDAVEGVEDESAAVADTGEPDDAGEAEAEDDDEAEIEGDGGADDEVEAEGDGETEAEGSDEAEGEAEADDQAEAADDTPEPSDAGDQSDATEVMTEGPEQGDTDEQGTAETQVEAEHEESSEDEPSVTEAADSDASEPSDDGGLIGSAEAYDEVAGLVDAEVSAEAALEASIDEAATTAGIELAAADKLAAEADIASSHDEAAIEEPESYEVHETAEQAEALPALDVVVHGGPAAAEVSARAEERIPRGRHAAVATKAGDGGARTAAAAGAAQRSDSVGESASPARGAASAEEGLVPVTAAPLAEVPAPGKLSKREVERSLASLEADIVDIAIATAEASSRMSKSSVRELTRELQALRAEMAQLREELAAFNHAEPEPISYEMPEDDDPDA